MFRAAGGFGKPTISKCRHGRYPTGSDCLERRIYRPPTCSTSDNRLISRQPSRPGRCFRYLLQTWKAAPSTTTRGCNQRFRAHHPLLPWNRPSYSDPFLPFSPQRPNGAFSFQDSIPRLKVSATFHLPLPHTAARCRPPCLSSYPYKNDTARVFVPSDSKAHLRSALT